jgi:hypothetical protein
MPEKKIEAELCRLVRRRGGMCLKFVSPGLPGVPDRIVITPDGRIIFAEIKADWGRVVKIQQWCIAEMRKRGADVQILKGLDEVKKFVGEVMPDDLSAAPVSAG